MVLDLFKLDGRVAVVTGGGRGLGQAMAGALAQAGADVVSVTRTAKSAETRQLVERCGRKFLDVRCDVGRPDERADLIDKITSQMGRVDILINNAGIFQRHPPEEYPLNEFDALLQVHLHAAFDLSQQVAPQMLERGRGKIINIGSVLSFEGGLNIPAYAAAKHALAGLTKSLANSWSHRGINVNCIAPGYFDTKVVNSLKDDLVRGPQILDRIPAGRWGDPDELGGLAVFLASDASNYVHGSVIAIDGGWLAR
ncbi:MAG: SDR family oxidoreductase [Planctomycetaceae bacterium]